MSTTTYAERIKALDFHGFGMLKSAAAAIASEADAALAEKDKTIRDLCGLLFLAVSSREKSGGDAAWDGRWLISDAMMQKMLAAVQYDQVTPWKCALAI